MKLKRTSYPSFAGEILGNSMSGGFAKGVSVLKGLTILP